MLVITLATGGMGASSKIATVDELSGRWRHDSQPRFGSSSGNLAGAQRSAASVGCTGGGSGGCSAPIGAKWDRWDMAGSTYSYCYAGCPVEWLIANSAKHSLGAFAGLVGVDHYWTGQGVPCIDGIPREFERQNALADRWKAFFPGLRFLSYRILAAVPYTEVVRRKIAERPDYFVRWQHLPGSTAPGNGSVCYNYES